jgi:hypothetical protein
MTRYVYVLISHDNGSYAAMCLISALSVRGVDAGAQITVLSDGPTLAMLKRHNHQLLEVADEVRDCSVGESPVHTSRILKTTLLQRLQSDFIFLDVDTVVVRPIAPKLLEPYSLQMTLDRSPQYPKPCFPDWIVPHYEQLGWEWPTARYYNSGVMLVRADEASRQLFEEWHRRWQEFLALGLHYDQPALNSSIHQLKLTVGCLPVQYNAMVRVNEAFRWKARVLHFFVEGNTTDHDTEYGRLINAVTSGRTLTSETVQKAVRRRWPLVEADGVRRHLKIGSFRGAWLCCRKHSQAKKSHPMN